MYHFNLIYFDFVRSSLIVWFGFFLFVCVSLFLPFAPPCISLSLSQYQQQQKKEFISHKFIFTHNTYIVCFSQCLFLFLFFSFFLILQLIVSTKLNYSHRSMTAVENCDHYLNLTCLGAVPFVATGSDANRKAIGYFGSALYFDDDRPVALIQVNDTY